MEEPQEAKDCLACKITSVTCLFGIGGYLFYQGIRQKGAARMLLPFIGAGCTMLGVGEIFDKSPFRGKSIDKQQ